MSANLNQFIVTLSPAHNIYLVGTANGFRSVTRIKAEAKRFDSFDAARTESSSAIGWPDSRVEDVGPAYEAWQLLDTAELRLQACNAATEIWAELDRDSDDLLQMAAALQVGLQDLGYGCAYKCLPNASCFLSLRLTDKDGVSMDLDWDPNTDGFDYETSGDDADEFQRVEDLRRMELSEGEGWENDPPEADAPEADGECDSSPVSVTEREIKRMLMRDDLTQCQTPLTPAQFREARAILVYNLRHLINAKIAELASGALMAARNT